MYIEREAYACILSYPILSWAQCALCSGRAARGHLTQTVSW